MGDQEYDMSDSNGLRLWAIPISRYGQTE